MPEVELYCGYAEIAFLQADINDDTAIGIPQTIEDEDY